jgi:hypothetical protein
MPDALSPPKPYETPEVLNPEARDPEPYTLRPPLQMMKSLSPIVVLFLLVVFRLDVITYPKLGGVLLMTVGMVNPKP